MATTNKERDAVMRAAIDRSFAELAKPYPGMFQVLLAATFCVVTGVLIGKFLL